MEQFGETDIQVFLWFKMSWVEISELEIRGWVSSPFRDFLGDLKQSIGKTQTSGLGVLLNICKSVKGDKMGPLSAKQPRMWRIGESQNVYMYKCKIYMYEYIYTYKIIKQCRSGGFW